MSERIKRMRTVPARRWVQYLLFWGFSFFVLSRFFSYEGTVETIDLVYTALFHISLLFCVCVNSYLLIPHLFTDRKYLLYSLFLILLILFSTWLNMLTFQYLADRIFPGYYFISYYEWYEILQFLVAYTAVTTLLQLSRGWFREAEVRREMAQLEQQKVQTELKALRAQINPHFLFNSLNHIYAMAVKQSPETAPTILQLSDLLRYTLRNLDRESVALEDEIGYLQQYVDLYRNRIRHPERLEFEVEGNPDGYSIAPLLLIVFVENCFKHGTVSRQEESIRIRLAIRDRHLTLETVNSIDEKRDLPSEESGTGLENVRRRLHLLYPDRHRLDIRQDDIRFAVKLEIEPDRK